jgi:hypothetical protein
LLASREKAFWSLRTIAIIGMCIEDLLWEAGCIVLGPVVSVADALAVLQTQRPDAALLDHTLADGTVAPVAAALTKRGVPFALLTAETGRGYCAGAGAVTAGGAAGDGAEGGGASSPNQPSA